ncbi:hypothetical protein ACFPIF_07125 [Brevundimonas faecalis]|uniref:hypothetical protein n=1 Tax=Brevundimonas faecalis TaxID=947378 RepID=UPI00361D5E6E
MTEAQVEALLRQLCVDLGFCLHGDAADRLIDHPPATVDEFARAVFMAEGIDYEADPRDGLKQAVRDMVALHQAVKG